MSKYSREEQETTILFNEADSTADVYSYNETLRKRLAQLAIDYPGECRFQFENERGTAYSIPKKWIKIRPPRTMTDEQRTAIGERLRKARG